MRWLVHSMNFSCTERRAPVSRCSCAITSVHGTAASCTIASRGCWLCARPVSADGQRATSSPLTVMIVHASSPIVVPKPRVGSEGSLRVEIKARAAFVKAGRDEKGASMYDLIVRSGTIVDGTGARSSVGDIGVKDGRIAHV